MARRNRPITPSNVVVLVSIIFFFMIILTWETRDEISPMEKSISHVIVPIQKGVTYFGDWLTGQVDFVQNIGELEAMNIELQEQVELLTYENQILEQSKLELMRLRALQELGSRYADYPKTGARVIGKDPGNWYSVFTIDKGTDDGIAVDMVVLAGAGLVGKIIEVGPGYAKIRSIIDDNSSVSAIVARTNDLCTVRGDLTLFNEGYLSVDYISDDINLVLNDEITTSHLGTVYPPGILIGEVIKIEDNPSNLTQSAYIKPYVNFKDLQEVLVINQQWGGDE